MKLRRLGLALAVCALSALAIVLLVPAVDAAPYAPSVPGPTIPSEPGSCGYIPYMTLGSSCTGAGFIVGSAMSLSSCQATELSYIFKALYSFGCDNGDWTFQCRVAKWC